MSRYLADTHILLWYWYAPERLSNSHRNLIETATGIHVSMASVWEMAIKASKGKLTVPTPLSQAIETDGFELLPIRPAHIEAVRTLPQHHGDPFDRMLIAQAQAERLSVLSVDRNFAAYDITLA